jgi:spermidine/putrescine transport system permease protein
MESARTGPSPALAAGESATAHAPAAARTAEGGAPRNRRLAGRLLDAGLNVYAGLALLYLLVPIGVILVFSFNDPVGRFNFIWNKFSLDAWGDPFGVPGIGEALRNSVEIAALSTLGATILGTLTALALVRYEFKGRAPVNFFIFIPLATPEVVLGAALLSLFLNAAVATGFGTIVIAHIMFNLSFVIVTVRSRLIGFDRSLEEAAQDLGATPWQTFRLITLPLIMPGVISAALLAFALSIDDFVITNFNAGSTVTFPLFIWGAARVAVPPQIYVIASMIFLLTLAAMLLTVWQQRRAERMAAVRPDEAEPSRT